MDSRGNYSYNTSSGNIRERGGERHPRERGERGDYDRRGPSDRSPGGRQRSQNSFRRDDQRNENYRGRRDQDNSMQQQQVHIKENSFNKQYSNSSLPNSSSNSNSNLYQSPFQNPYKIDSNTNKTSNVNDPSKDRLETYAKLKKISPVKFYISIIIAVILTASLAILGILAIKNNGLSASNIRDVTVGVAQGYLFYCGFMILAIGTGVLAFIRKWNNLLVTYCSFLFVSCLYICYFIADLTNVKTNCVEVMNNRWKDDFSLATKQQIEIQFECCGYYNEDDDPAETDECIKNESTRKRSFISGIDDSPVYYNMSSLQKRKVAEERGCAKEINNIVNKNMTMYIIFLGILLVLNIAAVVVTILDIKQYADILRELSNPFA